MRLHVDSDEPRALIWKSCLLAEPFKDANKKAAAAAVRTNSPYFCGQRAMKKQPLQEETCF